MYDGEFVNREASYFADRVRKESGGDQEQQIRLAFQIALGRNPTPAEVKQVQSFFHSLGDKSEALAGACRVLLNSNEFVYVD